MNFICMYCGSNNVIPSIENEIGFLYCNNCGKRRVLNNQDGGNTTNSGIEFMVPPGSSDFDIQLMKTLNEISTQTNENQRYDGNAQIDLHKALYGDKSQTGSGNKKKRKYKKKQYKKKSKKRSNKLCNKTGGKLNKKNKKNKRKTSPKRLSYKKKRNNKKKINKK